MFGEIKMFINHDLERMASGGDEKLLEQHNHMLSFYFQRKLGAALRV